MTATRTLYITVLPVYRSSGESALTSTYVSDSETPITVTRKNLKFCFTPAVTHDANGSLLSYQQIMEVNHDLLHRSDGVIAFYRTEQELKCSRDIAYKMFAKNTSSCKYYPQYIFNYQVEGDLVHNQRLPIRELYEEHHRTE